MAVSSGTLLKPATVEMLQTPQRLASGEETDYGLGWKVETVEIAGTPARMAGDGTKPDFIGGTTYLMTFPERAIVVAVTSNTSFADTKSIALGVAQAFAEQGKVRHTSNAVSPTTYPLTGIWPMGIYAAWNPPSPSSPSPTGAPS